MMPFEPEAIESSIRMVLTKILAQVNFLKERTRSQYSSKLHTDGSAILIPRLTGIGCYESAKLLDTLVLLYDKIYWDTHPNNLLIPECAEDHPGLHVFGVDEGFPDRFIEYMRQGIVTPLVDEVGMYSLPTESEQEFEIRRYLIYTNLDLMGWQHQPDVLESFANIARVIAPPDLLTKLIDRYQPQQGDFATVVRLLLNVEKSKALNASNVFVANPEEQLQWKILSGAFGEQFIKSDGTFRLDTLSLLRLFERLLLASPCRLSIDHVLRLREEIPARKLRAWLTRRVEKASTLLVASDPVDQIVREFDELVTEVVKRSKKGALFILAFSALAATLGAAVGGIPGAIAGSAAGFFAGEAADKASKAWYERYGMLNWVLNIHRYRSQNSYNDHDMA